MVTSLLLPPGVDSPVLRDKRHTRARAAGECADWLRWLELENKAARTLDDYERTVAVLLRTFPEKALEEFTDGDLAHLLAGFPRGSRRKCRSHLASFFGWAYLTRRIAANPLDFVPRQRPPRHHVPKVFTDEEVALLEGLSSPDGSLMAILFGTGIRKGEARHLRREHISLERRHLVVYRGKGSKDRVVPLTMRSAAAVADLDLPERLNPGEYLWYSKPGGGKVDRSGPLGETSFHRWYGRCIKAAGVRYLNPHTTRHTYATFWRREGLGLDEIQMLLGHESIQTTSDLYVHTAVEDIGRRMAAIEAGL